MKKKVQFIFIVVISTLIYPQIQMEGNGKGTSQPIQITGSRYHTGEDGVLRVFVNVWGHVNNPGRIMVDEGIDVATLLSITGGPKKGANMKYIRVYREFADEDGNFSHEIDLQNFIDSGNRDGLITILPNDTYIISQTWRSYFLDKIGIANTLMTMVNLYLNIENRNN